MVVFTGKIRRNCDGVVQLQHNAGSTVSPNIVVEETTLVVPQYDVLEPCNVFVKVSERPQMVMKSITITEEEVRRGLEAP